MNRRAELVLNGRRPRLGDYLADHVHRTFYGPIRSISEKDGALRYEGSCHALVRVDGLTLYDRGLVYATLDELPEDYVRRRALDPDADLTVRQLRQLERVERRIQEHSR